MKKETLNRMLEQVDDDLLQEGLAAPKKRISPRWIGAVAAALAVVLGAGIGVGAWLHGLPMDGGKTESTTAIAGGEKETIAEGATEGDAMTGTYWVPEDTVPLVGDYEVNESCMETPVVGEAIIFPGLQLAMKDHEGLDVLYVVDMDVFFDEAPVTENALQQEADVLTEEGYTVVEVKQSEGWIVLHMTAEEIRDFTAVRYGYGLRSGPLPMFNAVTSEDPDNDLAVEVTDDDLPKVIYGNSLPECNCTEPALQPQNGEVIIRHDLQHGIDQYGGEDVLFFVAAELYKDGKLLTGEDALYPLVVCLKESLWAVRTLGGPEEISVLAEAAVKQIENLEAPEGYAVVLRFAVGHEENDGVVAAFWWE